MTTSEKKTHAFSEHAVGLLEERYLIRFEDGRVETVDDLLDRISLGNPEYREMLASGDFLPNSPTIMNLHSPYGGTCSACFKFTIEDTMFDHPDGIMRVAMKAAGVLKFGGGVGYAFSKLRAKGSPVKSTHGVAMGPVGVLKFMNQLASMITQGGKRDAAQMGILHVDHPDIEEFIHVKDATRHLDYSDPAALSYFNISVAATKEMFAAVRWHRENPGVKPDERQERYIRLFKEIAHSAWLHGDPGFYFVDTSNETNPTPWLGDLDGTNPCGEVPLLPNEPCNLGSLNMGNFVHVKRGEIDWGRLVSRVRMATEYLDDVLDANVFPDPEIEAAAKRTRKLGLGVTGWGDALAKLGIRYDSNEAVALSERVSLFIQEIAHLASEKLGETKGFCPALYELSADEKDWPWARRNATVTCIAPTGTIGQLMGATAAGIEPHFALEYQRKRRRGGEWVVHTERVDFGDFVPPTAMEIDWRWHVRHQAAWQKGTDLAVSKTINLRQDATEQDIEDAFLLMEELGCKGGTIYRDGSRDVQVMTMATPSDDIVTIPSTFSVGRQHGREKLPARRNAVTTKIDVGDAEGYMIVGEYPDGRPGELFLNISRQGSMVDALYDAIAMLTSFSLQYGVPLEDLVSKFKATRFEPAGMTKDPEIPIATSILDFVFRRLELDYLRGNGSTVTAVALRDLGMTCPECDSSVAYEEGCIHCTSCAWNRCG
jgi:ribonucleoside-diphosphate reductase alpha chain